VGAGLEFAILGPLEVRRDDAPLPLGGPRQRALLALLLCNANRVVSRSSLIDELMSDHPAESAERTLYMQISRLRKALAAGGGDSDSRVVASPPGYLLRVEDGELDLHAFERGLADGRRALEQDDPRRAATVLREAEALWRGRPLADLEFEPFARVEVQRLQELRLLAVEERIDAELALGEHAALCPELEALVAEHPLRERLREQLMLALYRSGRQADALEVYSAGRLLLVEALALEPGPRLRELQRAILEQDPALELGQSTISAGTALAIAAPPEEPGFVDGAASASGAVPEELLAQPGTHGRRRHRGWWGVVTLGLAAAVVVFVIAEGAGGSTGPQAMLTGNALALIAPRDGVVEASVPLSAPPTDVASGFGSLWVTEASAGLLIRVDADGHRVIARIPVGTRPSGVAVGDGRVWVLDPIDDTVSAIDPGTDALAQTFPVGKDPSDLVFSDGRIWVADRSDGTVDRLDPNTAHTQLIGVGADPSGLAAASGAVWVADDESGMIERIDAATSKVTGRIRVGDAPAAIAATATALWVLDPLDATISKVDAPRDTVTATTALGGEPASLALSGRDLWVGDARLGTLDRIGARSGTVTDTVRVGGRVSALASAGGLWATVDAAGASHRGGTVAAGDGPALLDTIDPAASTAWNVPPTAGLGLVYDGLVTLDHVAGASGARLVPDLAMSLPVPTDDGLAYTFKLRPGIRYSTGTVVEPRDVTHSFERLFAIRSSGASLFPAIIGASACTRTPSRCNLSRGIVADDPAGTVTFHLARPDPDFLYKLTIVYTDVLPASTPDSVAQTPLPATGPYVITRYAPDDELLLTRNPQFEEWSAAAQPAGYPNRIVLHLDLNGATGAHAVADGTADFTSNLAPIPGAYATAFLRTHRSQVRVHPLIGTNFLFLNVHAPPFNDIRVRQALNLALDRGLIVNSYGGPTDARLTCQILPPGIPGYRPYCPYTRDPAADGRWTAPNLTLAKRLVAASGTAGMNVAVWGESGPQLPDMPYTVSALRQLGYRASVRLLPDSTFNTYTNNSQNKGQVIDGGWSADYPSADDFIGKLTCSYFVRSDGLDTTDASEFCDPAFDRQVAHAASLQTSDPVAADALWASLDRELTNLAIWLPTVTPNEIDLLSDGVGNYQYNPVWGALLDQLWVS
jgi:ABC-type transport system substrate-binding protein/DNA-binding SARP family transcriptional activator